MMLRKWFVFLFLLPVLLSGCVASPAEGISFPTALPNAQLPAGSPVPNTATRAAQPELTVPSLPTLPAAGTAAAQPAPAEINPLTGLPPDTLQLLARRPLLIKVQNVPRNSRPQWGLSMADIVFEYYIEHGDTRFAALFYGQQPEKVGPVRSARHVDLQLIEMYGAVFIYGGSYQALTDLLYAADFAGRLVREGPNTYPALFRYEPQTDNYLLVDTTQMQTVYDLYQIDNSRPVYDAPAFDHTPPPGGADAQRIFVRFSGGIYNRWDYDPESGRYLRYAETQNDIDRNNEAYELLTDRLTGEVIAADNLVVILAEYDLLESEENEVFDVLLRGKGRAYAARDGMIYSLSWQRREPDGLLHLAHEDGAPFLLRPGQSWYEILGASSRSANQGEGDWRFTFILP